MKILCLYNVGYCKPGEFYYISGAQLKIHMLLCIGKAELPEGAKFMRDGRTFVCNDDLNPNMLWMDTFSAKMEY